MTHTEGEEYPERYLFIKNILSCITIEIPPLRELRQSIPHMAGLLIGICNVESGKEIAGFDPEALRVLQNYDWPFNFTQLKRVISRLAAMTGEHYIKAKDVLSVLFNEQKEVQPSKPSEHSFWRPSIMPMRFLTPRKTWCCKAIFTRNIA